MAIRIGNSVIFRLSLLFSFLAVISEISLSFIFQRFGWISWRWIWILTPELTPIVPILYIPLFILICLILIVARQMHLWFGSLQGVIFIFASVFIYNLAMISGHFGILMYNKPNTMPLFCGVLFIVALIISSLFERNIALLESLYYRGLKWIGILCLAIVAVVPGWQWLVKKYEYERLPNISYGVPNLLIIDIDTLRADHTSPYGYIRNTTPYLNQIAGQGALFEMAISASSWTLPSHASIVTGVYPHEHGAEIKALDNRLVTIPELIRSRGYLTGAFSANSAFFTRQMGFGRGFSKFSDVSNQPLEWANRTILGKSLVNWLQTIGLPLASKKRNAIEINESFLAWVDENPKKPFFAILNYMDVHSPYLPPSSYQKIFSSSMPPDNIRKEWVHNYITMHSKYGAQAWIDAYDASIRYLDDQIKALFYELEKRKIISNTLVIITSDHGEAFGEHEVVEHGNSLYLETIHVPLIFYWPDNITRSLRINQPVSLTSLAPTLLEYAGGINDGKFNAPSLRPLLKSEITDSKNDACSELSRMPSLFLPAGDPSLYESMKSIIYDNWHYIVREYSGEELYDWKEDPNERKNLSKMPDYDQILISLRQRGCR
jgi:arylsulfatase A-like enzyme